MCATPASIMLTLMTGLPTAGWNLSMSPSSARIPLAALARALIPVTRAAAVWLAGGFDSLGVLGGLQLAGQVWLVAHCTPLTMAAIQGIVLTAAVADPLPGVPIQVAIAVAMVLLAESFGRDVVWQWRRHRVPRRIRELRASGIARRRSEER